MTTQTANSRAERRHLGNLYIARGNVLLVIFAICLAFAAMSIVMSVSGMLMSSVNFTWAPENLVAYVTERTALSTYVAIVSTIATVLAYYATKKTYALGDELLRR